VDASAKLLSRQVLLELGAHIIEHRADLGAYLLGRDDNKDGDKRCDQRVLDLTPDSSAATFFMDLNILCSCSETL
jgi:hypothetical protein